MRGLDRPFVEEKCELAIDTVLEIQRIGSPKKTELLQRNLWSTMDALAVHFDASGFTDTFRPMALRIANTIQFTDPDVLEGEFKLINDALGSRARQARALGFDRARFDALMGTVERLRKGKFGVGALSNRRFTFQRAMAPACHRPIGVLDTDMIGMLVRPKVPISVLIGVANIIALFGVVILTILTVVALLVILAPAAESP